MSDNIEYVSSGFVKKRYHIHQNTLLRWLDDEKLGFPRPRKFSEGGRFYYVLAEIEAWERERAAMAAGGDVHKKAS